MSESFQAHVNFTTVNGANPTTNRNVRCTPPTRTSEGVWTFTTSEAIATRDADISIFGAVGVTGVGVNIVKGANDFIWIVQTFIIAGNPGVLTLDDAPGAIIGVTLKRVNPA